MEVKLGLTSKKMHYFIASNEHGRQLVFVSSVSGMTMCQVLVRPRPSMRKESMSVNQNAIEVSPLAWSMLEATFAARHGCIELASDTELENEDSQRFHEKVGFKEVERVASYIKNLSHENRERGLIDVLILQRGLASLLRFQQLP